MSPARRSRRRADWPRGLYEPRPGYFVFREPGKNGKPGKLHVIGHVTLAFAKSEAIAANAHLASTKPSLVARIAGTDHTLAQLIERMPVPEKDNTAKQYRWAYNKLKARLGADRMLHTITTKDCADVLSKIGEEDGKNAELVCRSRLVMLFKRAMQLGWMESNPAEVTERPTVKVQRERLSLERFLAIRDKAPEWAQYAMNLALVTGADVSTVASMRGDVLKPDSDWKLGGVLDGHLLYRRGKTNRWLRVPLSLRLDAAGLTLGDLVHGRKGPLVVGPQRQADGHTMPARISEYFREARRAAGIPDKLPDGGMAPTFHEIRSLSKRLYIKQGGVDTKALLGHAGEAVAELYADPRGIEPVDVSVRPIIDGTVK